MSKERHTSILSGYELEQLEKSRLWNDAINWPKSWYKVTMKLGITFGLISSLGYESYLAIQLNHSMFLGILCSFVSMGSFGYWTTVMKAFINLLGIRRETFC
jgi:hypothetical protein